MVSQVQENHSDSLFSVMSCNYLVNLCPVKARHSKTAPLFCSLLIDLKILPTLFR